MRDWTTILALVPDSLDLSAEAGPSGGAIILVRDVLDVPGEVETETGTIPAGWTPGRVSPTPGLAHALAASFGKREAVPGRDGARVYLVRMAAPNTVASWRAQLGGVANAVAEAQVGAWGEPDLILGWRSQSVTLEADLVKYWSAPIRWVETPEETLTVIADVFPPGQRP